MVLFLGGFFKNLQKCKNDAKGVEFLGQARGH